MKDKLLSALSLSEKQLIVFCCNFFLILNFWGPRSLVPRTKTGRPNRGEGVQNDPADDHVTNLRADTTMLHYGAQAVKLRLVVLICGTGPEINACVTREFVTKLSHLWKSPF